MNRLRRVFVVVMDGVGAGSLPDAAFYGDLGSNTLGNIARRLGRLCLPNLAFLGLGNLLDIPGTPPIPPKGAACLMAESSPGKDSTTGHWELFGIILEKPFKTYPQGFPDHIVSKLEAVMGRKTLWNKPASGTEVIEVMGQRHLDTGFPILYTSGDSVMQIACHRDVAPPELLYSWCEKALALFSEPSSLARTIARPFKGVKGSFVRTSDRKDFSVPPPALTLFDHAFNDKVETVAIGKVSDIFAGKGIGKSIPTGNNREGLSALLKSVKEPSLQRRLVMANLVDFDSLWGHRNDVSGFSQGLREFDSAIPGLMSGLDVGDILAITADHGCDPTTEGTDHSREYVPCLIAGNPVKPGVILPVRPTFADLGATLAHYLDVPYNGAGESFAQEVFWEV